MDHRDAAPVVVGPRHRGVTAAVVGVLLAAGLVASAPAASARAADPEVDKAGCRGDSTSWTKLKVVPRDSGILEVTAVVFSDDSDIWEWRLKHNDDVSARGTVRAKDADRSFKVVRDMADFPGTDFIDWRAENTASGEVCKASVAY